MLKNTNSKTKVILGLSGGVDSSVVACLLKKQGIETQAVFMKNWDEDDEDNYCPAEEDLADAKAVAKQLDIPLHAVNFAADYWDKVFVNFLSEYEAGRTPNPDILCNKEIKFKVFLDYALTLYPHDAQVKIATGHYARIKEIDQQYFLLKGVDNNKDQSYFLYTLGQQQLSQSLFPLGELHKPQVREIAKDYALSVFDKKDSTGICFIGERNFNQFLKQFLNSKMGDMITPEGEIIGQHQGLIHYTLGQRKGLGIGGSKANKNTQATGEPWFVADKDIQSNQLIVVQGKNHPRLYHQQLTANKLHWISGQAPSLPLDCQAKIRYRQADQQCSILSINEEGFCRVKFAQQQFAITPGQSIVFYAGEICLGGGIIG